MRKLLWLLVLGGWPATAVAAEFTSEYTRFALDSCRLIEKGDEYVYAGTWACAGYKGIDIVVASSDDRSYVGFGANGTSQCAFRKTFSPFNTALSPIEWRLKDGQPIAAIERWNVGDEMDLKARSWLVVTALRKDQSCHVHYVAGSYPKANEAARRAADTLAEGFNCETDVPTVDSTIGPPGIAVMSCNDLPAE
jgi:hypothetical protein